MRLMSKPHPSAPKFDWDADSPALKAKLRMVELPYDESRDGKAQALFVHEDLWVPVAVVNGNVHILPGVPRLCKQKNQLAVVPMIPMLTGIHSRETYRRNEASCLTSPR